MSKQTEALKLALEALESCDEGDWSTGHVIHPSYDEDAVKQAMIAIEEALAQPEQEPVIGTKTWFEDGKVVTQNLTAKDIYKDLEQPEPEPVAWAQFSEAGNLIDLLEELCGGYVPLYTTPPQRTWVGLTDEDKKEYVAQDFGGNRLDAMDWAEKRLKEKNT